MTMSSTHVQPHGGRAFPRYVHVPRDLEVQGHLEADDEPALSLQLRAWEVRSRASDDQFVRVVAGQLAVSLEKSRTPWRSVESLANEIGVNEDDVRQGLRHLGSDVRRPVGANGRERDWYRLAREGLTWQEHWRLLRASVSRTPLESDAQ